MCGVAYVNFINGIESRIFSSILKTLDERGKDSWGFIALNTSRELLVSHTSIGRLNKFKVRRRVRKLIQLGYVEFIFHTRLATSGLLAIEQNIQPINIKNNLFLVHNGLILEEEDKDKSNHDLAIGDSYRLAIRLSEIPDPSQSEFFLNSLIGEISIVYYDANSKGIYAYSNVGGIYATSTARFTSLTSEPLIAASLKMKKKNVGIDSVRIPHRKVSQVGAPTW